MLRRARSRRATFGVADGSAALAERFLGVDISPRSVEKHVSVARGIDRRFLPRAVPGRQSSAFAVLREAR
jgi:hypothetical protein